MTADDYTAQRQYPRLNTGAEYRVIVSHYGSAMRGAQLKNLSASGCCLQLLMEEVPGLEVGGSLEKVMLVHPDLPMVPLKGTVMWVLGKHPGKTAGPVTVGLGFAHITPFIQGLIQDHVLASGQG